MEFTKHKCDVALCRDQGQDLQLQVADKNWVGGADKKLLVELVKNIGTLAGDSHNVVQNHKLDLTMAAEESDQGSANLV